MNVIRYLSACLVLALSHTVVAGAQEITREDLLIQGVSLQIAPSVEANIDTAADLKTTFAADPDGLTAVGELTGPGIASPIRLETTPGSSFRIPGLSPAGTFILQNVRLERSGSFIQQSTPPFAAINVGSNLKADVKVTQLTPQQLRDRGIVVDLANYDCYLYTVTYFVNNAEPVVISFTVQVDRHTHEVTQIAGESPFVLPDTGTVTPPRWTPPLTRSFDLYDPTDLPATQVPQPGVVPSRPNMPAAIVLPNSIAVLHDFFSVILIVSNGSAEGKHIELNSITASLRSQNELRVNKTIPAVSLGQPVPIATEGGVTVLAAQVKGQAEWVLEALKSGTYTLDIDVAATMRAPNQSDIALRGKTSAAINIVDPSFAINFSHPDSVLAGEIYSTFAFITNTGIGTKAITATSALPACSPEGTLQIDDVCLANRDQMGSKQLELKAGELAVLEYKLRTKRTGSVFASAGSVSDHDVLALTMGLSSTGLSPASLVMPYYARFVGNDFLSSYLRLLGFGYSIANSPASAAISAYPRVIRTDVFSRAVDIARAGQRIFIATSETSPQEMLAERRSALANLSLDLLGNEKPLAEWDALRRSHDSGITAGAALARELGKTLGDNDSFGAFVDRFAEATAHRSDFGLALVHGGSASLEIVRGNAITAIPNESSSGWKRQVAFADLSRLTVPLSGTTGVLGLIGRFGTDLTIVVHASGPTIVELVYPGGPDGALLRYTLPFSSQGEHTYRLTLRRGSPSIDVAEGTQVSTVTVSGGQVALPPLRIVAARQDLHSDPDGHKVAVLFNRPIDSLTPDALRPKFGASVVFNDEGIHYRGKRTIDASALQEDRRVVELTFAQALSTNVSRRAASGYELTVSGISAAGSSVTAVTVNPRVDNDRPAAMIYGRVLRGDNTPIAGADVILYSGAPQYDLSFDTKDGPSEAGSFFFEYVPRDLANGYSGDYTLQAVAPDGKFTSVIGALHVTGQVRIVDLQFLGRGAAEGFVRYEDGSLATGARVAVGGTLVNALRTATTDGQGHYSVSDLPVGPITFSASDAAGNVTFASGEIRTPGQILTRNLTIFRRPFPGTATIRGIVRLSTNLTPVVHAHVGVSSQGYGLVDSYSDSEGRFEFLKVPAGLVTVLAEEWNVSIQSAAVDFEIGADQVRDVELTLRARGAATPVRIEGDVKREDAGTITLAKVPGALVKIDNLRIVTADANGHYIYDSVPPSVGGSRIRAFDPATGRTGEATLDSSLAASSNVPINIPLANGYGKGSVRIRLVDVGGNPVSSNNYQLYREGKIDAVTPSAETGLWIIDSVPVGQGFTFHAVPRNPTSVWGDQQAQGIATVQFDGHAAGLTLRLPGLATANVSLIQEHAAVIGRVSVSYGIWNPETEASDTRKLLGDTKNAAGQPGPAVFRVPVFKSFTAANETPAQGFASVSEIFTYDGQTRSVELVLSSRCVVRGRVVNFDGITPMAGFVVSLRTSVESSQTTTSKPDGTFEFASVVSGTAFALVAEGSEGVVFRTGLVEGTTPAGGGLVSGLTIAMRRQGRVVGQVVYADKQIDPVDPSRLIPDTTPGRYDDNAPVRFAKYWLREFGFPQRPFGSDQSSLEADRDGRFVVPNVFEGSTRVAAWVPTDSEQRGNWSGEVRTESADVIAIVPVNIGGSGSALITVADFTSGSKELVANAEVSLVRDGKTFDFATTNGSGSVELSGIPSGSWSVQVFSKSRNKSGSADLTITAGLRTVREVALEISGSVTGQLIDPEKSSQPVVAAHVDLITARYSTRSTTDGAGSFAFQGVRTGSFELDARDPFSNRRAHDIGEISSARSTPFFRLELERFGVLHIRAFLPDDSGGASSQLAPLAEITVKQLCHTSNNVERCDQIRSLQGLADFTIDKLLRKPFKAIISEIGGSGRSIEFEGTIVETTSIDKTFAAYGSVRVAVTAGGSPVPFAVVTVSGGSSSLSATTDESGRATFSGIPLGNISVLVRATQDRSAYVTSRIDRQSVTVDVPVPLQTFSTLAGSVLAEEGGPSIGTRVVVDHGRSVLTDGAGQYNIPAIVTGSSVTLTFIGPDDSTVGYELRSLMVASGRNDVPTVTLDATPPQLLSISPADGATNVPFDSALQLLFSEQVLGTQEIILSKEGTVAAVSVNPTTRLVNGKQFLVTLTPSQPLASHTAYRLTVPASITDRSGHPLPSTRAFGFTTSDKTDPEIVKVLPISPVPINAIFTITMSEAIDPAAWQGSQPAARVVLRRILTGGALDAHEVVTNASLGANGVTITATPATETLLPGEDYRLFLFGVRDLQQNLLTRNTVDLRVVDSVHPVIVITSPTLATGVVAGLVQTATVRITEENDPARISVDIARVDYYQRNAQGWELVQTLRDAGPNRDYPFVFQAPTTGSTYSLRAIATDTSGNLSAPFDVEWALHADEAPKNVTVSLAPATIYAGSHVSATVSFIDEGTTATVRVTAEGRNGNIVLFTTNRTAEALRVNGTFPAAVLQFDLSPTLPAGSTVSFAAEVTDSKQQKSSATPVIVTLTEDTIAPQVQITQPVAGSSYDETAGTIWVEAIASDHESGLKSVRAGIDGVDTVLTLIRPDTYRGQILLPDVQGSAAVTKAIVFVATDFGGRDGVATRDIAVRPSSNVGAPLVSWLCPTSSALLPSGYQHAELHVRAVPVNGNNVTSVRFYRIALGSDGSLQETEVGTAVSEGGDHYKLVDFVLPASAQDATLTLRARAFTLTVSETATVTFTIAGSGTIEDATNLTIDASNAARFSGRTILVASTSPTDRTVVVGHQQLGRVIVLRNGQLIHQGNDASGVKSVDVTADRIYVECGGAIHGDALGYAGSLDGRGFHWPGTYSGGSFGRAGGSHGGAGGADINNDPSSLPGSQYGSLFDPNTPGSAGATASGSCASCTVGGGVIRLNAASSLIVDGRISVTGYGDGTTPGGAGGSIRIDTQSLAGSGEIRADGASGGRAAGGGGRVALYYDSTSVDLDAQVSAAGGNSGNLERVGAPGTVYLKRSGRTFGDLVIANRGWNTQARTRFTSVGFNTADQVISPTVVKDNDAQLQPAQLAGIRLVVNGDTNNARPIVANDATSITTSSAHNAAVGQPFRGLYRFDAVTLRNANVEVEDLLLASATIQKTSATLDGNNLAAPVVDLARISIVQSALGYALRGKLGSVTDSDGVDLTVTVAGDLKIYAAPAGVDGSFSIGLVGNAGAVITLRARDRNRFPLETVVLAGSLPSGSTAPIEVASSTWQTVGDFKARNVDLEGNTLVVASKVGDDGSGKSVSLVIFDVTDPLNPVRRRTVTVSSPINDIFISRGVVYIAETDGFESLSLVNPNATLLKALDTSQNAKPAVVVDGGYAFVSTVRGAGGIEVYDVSDPSVAPRLASFQNTFVGVYRDLQIVDADHLVGLVSLGGVWDLSIIDRSDLSNLHDSGALQLDSVNPVRAKIDGGNLYLASPSSSELAVVDVRNPTGPKPFSRLSTNAPAFGVDAAGPDLLVAASSQLLAVDVTDRTNPIVSGSRSITGTAWDVRIGSRVAYVVNENGLVVVAAGTAPRVFPALVTITASGSLVTVTGTAGAAIGGTSLRVTLIASGGASGEFPVASNGSFVGSVQAQPGETITATVTSDSGTVTAVLGSVPFGTAQLLSTSPVVNDANFKARVLTVEGSLLAVSSYPVRQTINDRWSDVTDKVALYDIAGGSLTNPRVVSVGGEPTALLRDITIHNGWLYAVNDELRTVNLRNTSQRGSSSIGGRFQAIAIDRNYAFVSAENGYGRFSIFDISNPSAPVYITNQDLGAPINSFFTDVLLTDSGDLIAISPNGWDVALLGHNGPSLFVKKVWDFPNFTPFRGTLRGSSLYLAGFDKGLAVLDISNTTTTSVTMLDTPGYARGVSLSGSTVAVADGLAGAAFAGTTPLRSIGSAALPGNAWDVAFSGTSLFAAVETGVVVVPSLGIPPTISTALISIERTSGTINVIGSAGAISGERPVTVTVRNETQQVSTSFTLDSDGSFRPSITAKGGDRIVIDAVDASNRSSAAFIGTVPFSTAVTSISVVRPDDANFRSRVIAAEGSLVALATGRDYSNYGSAYEYRSRSVAVIDLANRTAVREYKTFDAAVNNVKIKNGWLYTATGGGLRSTQLSVSGSVIKIPAGAPSDSGESVATDGHYAWMGYGNGHTYIGISDVSDPANPVFVGDRALIGDFYTFTDLEILGSSQLVGILNARGDYSHNIFDLVVMNRDPNAFGVAKTIDIPNFEANRIRVDGTTVYLTDSSRGIAVVDLTDVANPVITVSPTVGIPYRAQRIGSYLVTAAGSAGVAFHSVSGSTLTVVGTQPVNGVARDVTVSNSILCIAGETTVSFLDGVGQ